MNLSQDFANSLPTLKEPWSLRTTDSYPGGLEFSCVWNCFAYIICSVWNGFGISLFKLLMFNLICVRVLTILSVHHVCVPDANRGQRASGPWELELEI